MATGYTQQLIDKNLDFKGFALVCARAMGVCIMMRDNPMDEPIPEEFKTQPYHRDALKKAQAAFTKLSKITSRDAQEAWGRRAIKKEIALNKKHDSKSKAEGFERMEAMLKEVQAWEPPTKDHQPFKDFMIRQLTSSIGFDKPSSNYYAEAVAKLENTGSCDHYRAALKKAKEEIVCHKKHWAEEVARVNERNTWIRKLRESLGRYSTKV